MQSLAEGGNTVLTATNSNPAQVFGQNMGMAPEPLRRLRGQTIRAGHPINPAARPADYLQAIMIGRGGSAILRGP
eukprot:908507-Amphidinium_carterae.1